MLSLDCGENKSCINRKCQDPCISTTSGEVCGENAKCTVMKHNPICSCPPGTTGDPFIKCNKIGNECTKDDECLEKKNTLCIGGTCTDLCDNKCGTNAKCSIIDRKVVCSCPSGLTGNPFTSCIPI